MKPFSLETVLKFRKRRRDEVTQRLIRAEQTRDIVADRLREKQQEYKNLLIDLEVKQKKGVTIELLIMYEEQILYFKHEILSIKRNLEDKERIVENEKKHLMQTAKEYEVMIQLKDRQNSAWKNYLNKEEMKQLDEVAVMRHIRNE